MTLSLLCVREYGCISETHREEEDRRREAGGVDSEITWLTYIYSPEKREGKSIRESLFCSAFSREAVNV